MPQWAHTGEPAALTVRGLMVAEVSLGVVIYILFHSGWGMIVGKKGGGVIYINDYQLLIRLMNKKG